MYGGFAGNETSLAQRDRVTNVTLLDGDLAGFVHYADNPHHVVRATGTSSAFLDGFTVRGGRQGPGGGIRLEVENATLAHLILRENQGLALRLSVRGRLRLRGRRDLRERR